MALFRAPKISIFLILFLILFFITLLSLTTGTVKVSVSQFFKLLFAHFGFISLDKSLASQQIILWQVRLPRLIAALFIGAGLATAGVIFQALLRNPMADPYVLGVSSGAALGVVLSFFFNLPFKWLGFPIIPLVAFIGSFLTIWLVYLIASWRGRLSVTTLLLTGIVISSTISALIMLLYSVVDTSKLPSIIFWMMGNLAWVQSNLISGLSLYVILALIASFFLSKSLNALALGEEAALYLGIDPIKVRRKAFFLASMMTGVVVAAGGVIGFIGLIIPHACRLLFGSDHRILIPTSALVGAIFLILCDTLSRTILPNNEIPVGVITALCGGPFFLYLLISRSKEMV